MQIKHANLALNTVHALGKFETKFKNKKNEDQSKDTINQTTLLKVLLENAKTLRKSVIEHNTKIENYLLKKPPDKEISPKRQEMGGKRGRKSKGQKEDDKIDELIKQIEIAQDPNSELNKKIKNRLLQREKVADDETDTTTGKRKTHNFDNDEDSENNSNKKKAKNNNASTRTPTKTVDDDDDEESSDEDMDDDEVVVESPSKTNGNSERLSTDDSRNNNQKKEQDTKKTSKQTEKEFKIRLKSNKTFDNIYNSSKEIEQEIRTCKPDLKGEISARINYKRTHLSIWTNNEVDIKELESRWPNKAFKYGTKICTDDEENKIHSLCMWARELSIEDEQELMNEYDLEKIIKKNKHFKLETRNKEAYEYLLSQGKVRIGTFKANIEKYIIQNKIEQCDICYKTNHTARWCRNKNKEYCKKCGTEGHIYENCAERRINCINCGGKHMADDRWNCQRLKRTINSGETLSRMNNENKIKGIEEEQINEETNAKLLKELIQETKLTNQALREGQAINALIHRETLQKEIKPVELDEICNKILDTTTMDIYKRKLMTINDQTTTYQQNT
jgi:hypothetical protein